MTIYIPEMYRGKNIESVETAIRLISGENYREHFCEILKSRNHQDGNPSGIDDVSELDPLGTNDSGMPRKFPVGLWFRGEASVSYDLTPAVFRTTENGASPNSSEQESADTIYLDEKYIFNDIRLNFPDVDAKGLSDFDALCAMRHHFLPTRLLDWSESILVALFFAVYHPSPKGNNDGDGCLYALNAFRLNRLANLVGQYRKPGIFSHNDLDVFHRAAMVHNNYYQHIQSATVKNWQRRFDMYDDCFIGDLKQCLKSNSDYPKKKERQCSAMFFGGSALVDSDIGCSKSAYEAFFHLKYLLKSSCPVAVLPNRNDPRMVAQLSAFTIHGGKHLLWRDCAGYKKLSDLYKKERVIEKTVGLGISINDIIEEAKNNENIDDNFRISTDLTGLLIKAGDVFFRRSRRDRTSLHYIKEPIGLSTLNKLALIPINEIGALHSDEDLALANLLRIDTALAGSPAPTPFLKKFIIPKENKKRILQYLDRIGINEATLFPDRDNYARYVKRRWSYIKDS